MNGNPSLNSVWCLKGKEPDIWAVIARTSFPRYMGPISVAMYLGYNQAAHTFEALLLSARAVQGDSICQPGLVKLTGDAIYFTDTRTSVAHMSRDGKVSSVGDHYPTCSRYVLSMYYVLLIPNTYLCRLESYLLYPVIPRACLAS